MLIFCPTCANILIVEQGERSYRFACNTCPYVYNLRQKVGLSLFKYLTFGY